jgi:hypothetical protein
MNSLARVCLLVFIFVYSPPVAIWLGVQIVLTQMRK